MPQLIDWELAARNLGGTSLLAAITSTALEECSRYRKQLDRCLAERDVRGVQVAAHTIGGVFRVFGCSALQEAARAIELQARNQDLAACAAAWPELRELVEQAVGEIRAFRSRADA